MNNNIRHRLAWVAGLALGMPGVALAQESAAGNAPGADSSAASALQAGAPVDAAALQALAVAQARRAIMLDLRVRADAGPEDYQVAALAIDQLRRQAPEDAGLLRRGIEAAFASGDTALLEAMTRDLVRLDPADTVAQLRLISMRIGRAQTVEARAQLYDRFLGTAGRSIHPSVRSRLALDAALLQREVGNPDGFIELLSQAIALDSTNKGAASLAAQFFASRMNDPLGRLELQVNLLYTDPVDPNVHTAISRELLAEGAFQEARRFFANAAGVARLLGRDDEALLTKQMELTYLIDDPALVVERLDRDLGDRMIAVQQRLDNLIAQDLPTEGERQTEDVRLPRDLEFLRLLAADAAGLNEARETAMASLTKTIAEEVDVLYRQGANATNPAVRSGNIRELVSRFVQLQIVRLLLDMDTDQVESDLENLGERLEGIDPVRELLEPWRALAAEDYERTLSLLTGDEVSALARLCGALAMVRSGETEQGVQEMLIAANALTTPAMAAWARREAMRVGGEEAVLTDTGREMARFVQRVPEWMDRMIEEPSSFMLLRVEPTEVNVPAGHEPVVRVTIENIAPIPLGFGADRTISSRLLISPRLDLQMQGFIGAAQPEILELDQRFRLGPGERLSLEIPADPGYTGWVLGSNAHVTVRERWRVLQDFWIGNRGSIESGPVALTVNTPSVRRQAAPEANLPIAALLDRIANASAGSLPSLLSAVRTRLLHDAFADEAAQHADEIADALAARFRSGNAMERQLLLAMLPNASQTTAMTGFDDLALAESVEGFEVVLTLLTRTIAADHPRLVALGGSQDPEVARFAGMVQQRLLADRPGLGGVGPGIDELSGMTPRRFVNSDSR